MSCKCAHVCIAQPSQRLVGLHFADVFFGCCSNSFVAARDRDMKFLLLQAVIWSGTVWVDGNIGKN